MKKFAVLAILCSMSSLPVFAENTNVDYPASQVATKSEPSAKATYVSAGALGGKMYACKVPLVLVIRGDGKTIACAPRKGLAEPGEKPFVSDNSIASVQRE